MASAPFSTAARAQSQSPAGASSSGRRSGERGVRNESSDCSEAIVSSTDVVCCFVIVQLVGRAPWRALTGSHGGNEVDQSFPPPHLGGYGFRVHRKSCPAE